MSNSNGLAADELKAIVERIEKLELDKENIKLDIISVYEEAKMRGFDTKIIRELVRIRRMDKDKYDEHEMLLATYMGAVGMI